MNTLIPFFIIYRIEFMLILMNKKSWFFSNYCNENEDLVCYYGNEKNTFLIIAVMRTRIFFVVMVMTTIFFLSLLQLELDFFWHYGKDWGFFVIVMVMRFYCRYGKVNEVKFILLS